MNVKVVLVETKEHVLTVGMATIAHVQMASKGITVKVETYRKQIYLFMKFPFCSKH